MTATGTTPGAEAASTKRTGTPRGSTTVPVSPEVAPGEVGESRTTTKNAVGVDMTGQKLPGEAAAPVPLARQLSRSGPCTRLRRVFGVRLNLQPKCYCILKTLRKRVHLCG